MVAGSVNGGVVGGAEWEVGGVKEEFAGGGKERE